MPEALSLHLLWITENYPPSPGGMAVSCDRIIRGLRSLGMTIDIVHLSHSLAEVRETTQQQGCYIGWPLGDDPSHTLNLLFERLAHDSQRARFTHLVAFGGNLSILAAPTFAAWLNLPLVTLLRGNDFDTAIFSAQRSGPLRLALECSAKIVTVSRDKQARIAALYPSADIAWIANGIDLEDWCMLPSDRVAAQAWRNEAALEGKRILGLFGQIKAKKGGLHLLESLTNAGLEDRLHLLLVGDLDPAILDKLTAENPRLSHTLHPFGDRYALLRHYGACDAVAIPSYYDGTPNVLLEAMGLGIPMVASTAGGMGDLLEDGVHGFLFAPGDPHGCRKALVRYANASAACLKEMGQACLSRAREYTTSRESQAYLNIFQSTRTSPALNGETP